MPVPQPEEVMELAADLKEARRKVAELESRWEAFFSQAPAAPMNLKPRIIQFLEARPDVAFSTATVSEALEAKENSVGPYLSDLAKEGKIERRGRGLYGAVSVDIDAAREYANESAREKKESPDTINW